MGKQIDKDDLYAAYFAGGYGAALVEAWEEEDREFSDDNDEYDEEYDEDNDDQMYY